MPTTQISSSGPSSNHNMRTSSASASRGTATDVSPASVPRLYPTSSDHVVERTRAGGVLIALSAFFVILLLLVIFIFQNMQPASLSFFGFNGQFPLALAMLSATIAGALLMTLAAGTRILQLRHTASRHKREETKDY